MTEQADTKPFEWPVRVYYEDTDAQGVVYYANYFRFMERTRTEWLRALGVNQEQMLNEERRMFVVTKTELEFIVPARFNDELIVTAGLAGLTRAVTVLEGVSRYGSADRAAVVDPRSVDGEAVGREPDHRRGASALVPVERERVAERSDLRAQEDALRARSVDVDARAREADLKAERAEQGRSS